MFSWEMQEIIALPTSTPAAMKIIVRKYGVLLLFQRNAEAMQDFNARKYLLHAEQADILTIQQSPDDFSYFLLFRPYFQPYYRQVHIN